MSRWSDYQSPTKNYSPRRRVDGGARMAVIAVLFAVAVVLILAMSGVTG